MAKKKDKKKKGKGAEKTQMKTEKNAEKKMKKILKQKGEENVEALIAEYQEQGKRLPKVLEEKCDPPSPRSSCTLTPHPDKEELLLFGGEFFNGNKTFMYNDLFVYSIKNNTWTVLKCPGAPPPRSSHQAVAVRQGGGQMWMFGGEFASPSQSQFYHYKDLWAFHFHSNKWEKVSVPGGPSARSGHRMVCCKRQIFVFGGFHDNLKGDYKYFNDMHAFDLDTYTWMQLQPSGIPPAPRSGCCLAVTQDERSVVVFGGYSKAPVRKDVDKGTVHTDMLLLAPDGKATAADGGVSWRWSQIKQSGTRPSPRCSCAVVGTPGNRALVFGGVVDDEEDEDLEGKFYNDMFTVQLDSGKWYEVQLRGKKEQKEKKKRRRKKGDKSGTGSDNEQCDSEDDIEDNVERLSVMDSQNTVNDGTFTVSVGPQTSASSSQGASSVHTAAGGDSHFWPCARMNASLAVRGGVLYVYGGIYEEGEKQVTLQDMYSLDLHKLDEWKTLVQNEADKMVWEDSDSDDSDGSEDEEGSDEDEESDGEEMDTDDAPVPSKDESANDYFSRNKDYWMDKADEVATREGITATAKQLKKAASKMADEFFQEHNAKS